MLIELAANERAVHGDFFNSKNLMPVVYPSFSMMMQLTFTSHPFFYISSDIPQFLKVMENKHSSLNLAVKICSDICPWTLSVP